MSRMVLGALLLRNPTSISTNSVMPKYAGFQPLDGTIVPLAMYDRPEITLVWDRVSGVDLWQLMAIIEASQVEGSRDPVLLPYNDGMVMDGTVFIASASVVPIPGTGAYYEESWRPHTKYIPQDASVTITIVPYEYKTLRGI